MLAACASHGVPIVPQGGNTGLVGAGVPRGHELLLSLQRLTERRRGRSSDRAGDGRRRASRWRRSRRSHALPDSTQRWTSAPATRARSAASSRATPAAPAALRHGTARAHVAGLEAVLADGTVVSPAGGTDQGQRRLRPAGAAGRVGGDARGHHPGALEAVAAAAIARDSAGAAAVSRRGRGAAGLAARQCAVAGELRLLPRRGTPARARLPAARVPGHRARAVLRDHRVRSPVRSDRGARRGARTGRDRGRARRRRHRRPRRAVAAARGPRRGDQRRRDPAQARRRRAPGRARSVPGRGARRRQRAGAERAILFGHLGDGNVHVNVLGADPRTRARTTRCSSWCSSAAARSAPSTASACRRRGGSSGPAAPARSRRCAAIKRALDPANLLNPGAVLAL